MTTSDMRKDTRYQIAALVSFWWSYHGGTSNAGQGVTQDISQRSLWIVTDTMPPPQGARIQMTVTLPRMQGSRRSMTLAGEGIVVRSESWETTKNSVGPPGFAAVVQFYPEQSGDADLLNSYSTTTPASAYSN